MRKFLNREDFKALAKSLEQKGSIIVQVEYNDGSGIEYKEVNSKERLVMMFTLFGEDAMITEGR